MSATNDNLIARGEHYLTATELPDTPATWDWVMDAATSGLIDLDVPPTTPAECAAAAEQFAVWIGANAAVA